MRTKKSLLSILLFIFLFLTPEILPQNHNYKTSSTETDTLYYLPDSTVFFSQYSISDEVYNIFTIFDSPENWESFRIKEIHFLFSEMVKGDTLRELKFFQDTLKTLIYSQTVNEVLDSINVYPNWYKVDISEEIPLISGSVEIPVYVIDEFSLCITDQISSSGNSIGFYESTQSWRTTSDYPIKLVIERTTTDIDEDKNLISTYSLLQNYPNPFNPNTTISYSIANSEFVELKVYDLLGNQVSSLVNEYKSAGNYSTNFSASGLSSGIYFYRIRSGNFVQSKKLILLK